MHPAIRPATADWLASALFGRDAELDQLRACLRSACAGQGSLVLVAGEAGIGKTTLTAVACYEATHAGALVLAGGCYDLTTTPPYGPWVEIARGYPDAADLPLMPEPLRAGSGMAGIDSQAALFDLTGRFLAAVAARRPLVLCLEDLHWSDAASLDLLRYLSRMLAGQPILLLVTYRDDEIGSEHPLVALLPALVREGRVHRLHLQRLDHAAVHGLVRERFLLSPRDEDRLVAYLQQLAEGNPFFTKELLYALEDQRLLRPVDGAWGLGNLADAGVPTLIQHVTASRVARLDPPSRTLLDLAAVIGYDVQLKLVQALYGDDAELDGALRQTVQRHVLLVQPDRRAVRFSHALLRQAIYEAIPMMRRKSLHRQVGERLANQARADPATVANHFYESGDLRALDWLVRAADRARDLFAPQAVIDACRRAIELAEQQGDDALPHVYRLRGWAYDSSGEFEQALRDYELALTVARRVHDHRQEWQALLDLAALWAARNYQRTGTYCREAVDLARSVGDSTALGHSLNRLGNWHVNADRPNESLRYHHEALEIFERIGDRHGLASTLDLLGVVYGMIGDEAQALRCFERAIPLLRQLDDRQTLSSALTNVAGVASGIWSCQVTPHATMPDSLGAASGVAQEAIQVARDIGWRAGEAFALKTASVAMVWRGEVRAGLQGLNDALDIAASIEHRQWIAHIHLDVGSAYVNLRIPERALIHLRTALESAAAIDSEFLATGAAGLLASAYVQAGDHDAAERAMQDRTDPQHEPSTNSVRVCWFARAELLLAQGQPQRALSALDRVLSGLSPLPAERPAEWLRLRGEALLAMRRFDDAMEYLADALWAATTFDFPLARWRVHASLRRLYIATGQRDDARAARDAALVIVANIAAQFEDADMGETFQRNAHVEIEGVLAGSTESAAYPASLTPRELEILYHLVAGYSDREIADLLSVSHRTVGNHVSNILGKLGVTSRTAAATLALREGLVPT